MSEHNYDSYCDIYCGACDIHAAYRLVRRHPDLVHGTQGKPPVSPRTCPLGTYISARAEDACTP